MNKKQRIVGILAALVVIVAVVLVYVFDVGGLQGKIFAGKNVTRAELAKLLTNAMGSDIGECEGLEFSDVKETDWFFEYVCYVYQEGIMMGSADGKFKPFNYVSRAEAAKVFSLAYDIEGGLYGGPEPDSGDPYVDVKKEDNTWYYQYVWNVGWLEIADVKAWKGAKFRPMDMLTKSRAQLWADNFGKIFAE